MLYSIFLTHYICYKTAQLAYYVHELCSNRIIVIMISRATPKIASRPLKSPFSSGPKKNIIRFSEKIFAVRWFKKLALSWQASLSIAVVILLLWNLAAVAQNAPPDAAKVAQDVKDLRVGLDTIWVMIAGMLVIFMNAGFCMLEAGMCRQKNAVNVLAKNLIVFALSTIAFWIMGFGLMFSDGNGFIGTSGGFLLSGADNSPAMTTDYKGIFGSLNWTGVPLAAKFFFQLAFAGTAATIVSGAVAERIKFVDFLI